MARATNRTEQALTKSQSTISGWVRCDRMIARRKGYFYVEESDIGPIALPVD